MTSDNSTHERTCVVCRQKRSPHKLLGFSAPGGVLAPRRPTRGRGAWVCLSSECLRGLTPAVAARAFRSRLTVPPALQGAALICSLRELAHRRLLETLGLARRSGAIRLGIDAVSSSPTDVIIAATDLAARSHAQALRLGASFVDDAETLGAALGSGRVGVLAVLPGRFADDAAYWLSLWQATLPTGAAMPVSSIAECGDDATSGQLDNRQFPEVHHHG